MFRFTTNIVHLEDSANTKIAKDAFPRVGSILRILSELIDLDENETIKK